MHLKQVLVHVARQAGMYNAVERLRALLDVRRHRTENTAFMAAHPDVPLPPPALAYDAYGSTSAAVYLAKGRATAECIATAIRSYVPNPQRIFEWGCGPGRVIRHLPVLFPSAALTGSDYNAESIAWCQTALPGITFAVNALTPPLPFPTAAFDVAYAVSVFTHLSEPLHYSYLAELERVVVPGGLILFTTHGDNAAEGRLLPAERAQYRSGNLVIRDHVAEGKRGYSAYHSPRFVRDRFLAGREILAHQPGPIPTVTAQDLWIVRR